MIYYLICLLQMFSLNALAAQLDMFQNTNSSQVFNHRPAAAPKTEDLAQFRFKIHLQPYGQVVTKDRDGRKKLKQVPLRPIEKVFRARVGKANHFYVEKFHFETSPVAWTADIKKYDSQLKIYKRFGPYNEVEEYLTSLDFSGLLTKTTAKLSRQNDKMYDIEAYASKEYRNKEGQLMLKIKVLPPSGISIQKPQLLSRDLRRK